MAALAAVVGASAAVYWPAAHYTAGFWLLCSAVGALAVVARRWHVDLAVSAAACALAMGYAAWAAQAMQAAQQDWRERVAKHPVDELRGHIVGLPDSDAFRTRFVLREATTGQRIRLSWYDDAPALPPGTCWVLRSRLRGAHGSVNAGGFDYEQWLFRERLVGSASVRRGAPCDDDEGAGLDKLRAGVSAAIRSATHTHAGQALIPALVVGDRRGLSDEDWSALRRTGTSHLVAISGLHIGLMALVGYALGAWLWRRSAWLCRRLAAPRAGAVLGLILAAGYAALSGFALPAQRALIMVAVFVACVLAGRGTLAWHALGLAAIAVLLRDPLSPLSPGFWLSFGAVAWIILIARTPIYRDVAAWVRWPLLQLGLSIGLVPLTAVWFGEVSLLGPAVNFVLIPLFSVLVPLLLLAVSLSTVGVTLPLHVLDFSMAGLLSGLHGVGQWSAGALPLAVNWQAAALAVCALLLVVAVRGWGARVLGALLLIPLLTSPADRVHPGEARLDIFDVGQGLAVLVRTAEHALLYDAGPAYRSGFDAGAAIVVPSLRAMGVDQLDRLMVSHGDGDHAGGVAAVRTALPVHDVLGHGGRACTAGQRWTWDGVDFVVLHPTATGLVGNNASCVLRVTNARGVSALLPGDIERSAEAQLLAREVVLQSDVLVLPHHGSSSSSSAVFLDTVQPQLAVASVGYANRWGFPTEPVRGRVQARGAALLSTAHQGQIQIALGDRAAVQRAARVARPRLWRHQPAVAWIANPSPLSSPDD